MRQSDVAGAIREGLALESPPVGIALVTAPPEGVRLAGEQDPSPCSLWRRAERELFYAPPGAHFNCVVGAHVLGFDLPPAGQEELAGLVETMASVGYFDPAEAANLPRVDRETAGILYGPLGDLPVEPDLVVCWVSPVQAMLLSEAVGTSVWQGTPGMRAFGRPGCGALPVALSGERAALSFGCAGMRVYTEVSNNALLCVLPYVEAVTLARELPRIAAANAAITGFHEERRRALAGGAAVA